MNSSHDSPRRMLEPGPKPVAGPPSVGEWLVSGGAIWMAYVAEAQALEEVE
jgi:hypothetical protein